MVDFNKILSQFVRYCEIIFKVELLFLYLWANFQAECSIDTYCGFNLFHTQKRSGNFQVSKKKGGVVDHRTHESLTFRLFGHTYKLHRAV